MSKGRLAPLTGVAFVVLAIIAFVIGGEPPDPSEDSAQKIVDFYKENKDAQIPSAILGAIAGTLFVFFGGCVRRVLRDAEGPGGILSAVAFAGTIIFATGLAIDGAISFALADTIDKLDPVGAQALSALYSYDFVVFALGLQLFLLAMGISVVRHRALPSWLGWIAIVLGVLAMTPIGFFVFLATGILVLVISVMLTMRARPTPAGAS